MEKDPDDSDVEFAPITTRTPRVEEEREHETINELNRIASSKLGRAVSALSASSKKNDPRLDPTSPEFDHYRWAQTVLDQMHEEGIDAPQQSVVFKDLSISGSGAAIQYQETLTSVLAVPFRSAIRALSGHRPQSRRILQSFDGLLQAGELLLVLGRPGSGCTTFLKTITGHLGGLTMDPNSTIHYEGISFEDMIKNHRGEVAYNREVKPNVLQTSNFISLTSQLARSSRSPPTPEPPHKRLEGLTRAEFCETLVQVVTSVFGLTHAVNTKVGNEFVRGVSGGERKRVSIAEMFLSRCRLGAWDNSTRGLDAASALRFVRAQRLAADMGKSCHAIAAYQASQSMYDLFDKVVVLYEGYQIYYGPRDRAVSYFEDQGWQRPERQVSGDYLTAITNPNERTTRPGMESKVPRTAKEFNEFWKRSPDEATKQFQISHEEQQARHTRSRSPYLLSIPMQIRLCTIRAYQRVLNDLPTAVSPLIVQLILALIIGSVFYNTPDTSSYFFQKGAVCYFAVLMNALLTINEILQLYSQRAVVEKQAGYAFVHPFTEALASIIIDLPIKLLRISVFSIVLYFMANLRREAGNFFIFYLFLVVAVLAMSGLFRSLGALTKSVGQAMAMAGVLVLCIIVYTGFTLPQPYMHPWFSWIRWINPVYYTFEALIANEFHGKNYECSALIPSYGTGTNFVCSAVGSVAGQTYVSGDAFINDNYEYYYSHLWRNFGILIAFMIFFNVTYLTATEYISRDASKAEALVYRPGHVPQHIQDSQRDSETGAGDLTKLEVQRTTDDIRLPEQTDIFSWKSLQYEIPVKEGTRRLLDDVNGWVKPGTLTALTGVSGARKTTLLDVLAQRVSIGVVSGDVFVNGKLPTANFPRRTGYVQQQDLHMDTTTVREAHKFSAMLRQPRTVSKQEKYDYVEQVIQVLGMEDFAEAVVGSLGEGLNVEQRKLLSIGVELAAKPTLLIFLDEPTSGLDSQSSWTICQFLRRLADHGQAVLATIHQPKQFILARLENSPPHSSNYFERSGARPCETLENPAEYILDMVAGDGCPDVDWVQTWKNNPEYLEVIAEVDRLHSVKGPRDEPSTHDDDDDDNAEFAMPILTQLWVVLGRCFQAYYRRPDYIYSKFVLGIVSGLFIGFSFYNADNSEQGFQNALFSIFLLCTIFNTLANAIMPNLVAQRSLYEVRERPSRTYSWQVFIISQMLVEVPWQFCLGVCSWASFYWAVFGTNQTSEQRVIVLLYICQFFMYAASMAQFVVCAIPEPTLAAMVATLMFGLSFIFNGVMQPPGDLPRFWIFISSWHGRSVECSSDELNIFNPPSGQTCYEYMAKYLESSPGAIYNPNATTNCEYCSMTSADEYLATREIYYDDRWRDYGIFWCYFIFNMAASVLVYYLFRVQTSKAKVSRG
ncbi:hypothetical protein N7486_008846 [Penicillium sp. IBT 16267x]|nr:hypothetical protein N7486_008846 [Penicillium sp. IBT 16267x]